MTDLQVKILDLLKEIDAFCRENDIEWYLAAGTALGAVRHQGFIPWDDDADIYMTKANWEKFFSLRHKLPDDRVVVAMEEDYSCGYTINRYVDTATTRLYRYHCASPQPGGIIIDILVLDPVPASQDAVKDYVVNLTEFSNLLVKATTHTHRCPYPVDNKKIWQVAKSKGKEKALDEWYAKTFKYNDENGDGYFIQRDPTVPHVWRQEAFGKPQYVPFEDTKLPIAAMVYESLCGAFNEEWMYVPSSIDREQHIKALNLHMSYRNAFDDYLRITDLKYYDDLYTQRQESVNMLGEMNKAQEWERLKLAAAKVKLTYRKNRIEPSVLKQMLEEKRYEELDEYFAEYLNLQTTRNLIGGPAVKNWLRSQAPFYVDIDDVFLAVCLRNQMRKGATLSGVNKILTAREQCGGALSPELQQIKELVSQIKENYTLFERKQYPALLENARALLQQYPENLYLLRQTFLARFYMAEDRELTALQKELEQLRTEDDVLQYLLADTYWRMGDQIHALSVINRFVYDSTHGLVLLQIKNKLLEYVDNTVRPPRRAYEVLSVVMNKLGEDGDKFLMEVDESVDEMEEEGSDMEALEDYEESNNADLNSDVDGNNNVELNNNIDLNNNALNETNTLL